MASFTDQILKSRPYVEQLPLEVMAQASMYKQAKYEQGVQKIQAEIDKVGGLDIYKDSDRQYVQSKLNQLGSRLKSVAAGDFSNFQLVNSVGGMATQISKDPNVMNAVYSTATLRKEIQKMNEDTDKTSGSNIYNKDLFLQDVNKWTSDKTVGAAFNYQYTPHRDVFKKLVEIGAKVGIDSNIVQQLFQTDAKGNQIYEDGKLQYNDVMAETLLKGKDKEKLLQAFQVGLDAGDYKQLSINGKYELKGKTPEQLTGMLDETFLNYQKNAILQKERINDKILEIKSKDGISKESKDAIADLEEKLVMLDENVSKKKQNVDQLKSADPDSIRSTIYTNNFIDTIADSLSEKETYTKYSKNPAVEILLDREKFQYTQDYNAAKMAQDRWAELFKAGIVDEKGKPTGANSLVGAPRDLPIPDQERRTYFTDRFEDGLNADVGAQKALYEKVAIAHWMATNSGKVDPQTGQAFTEDGMKKQIKLTADKLGISYNDYIVLQGKKASDVFNSSKNSLLGNEYTQDFKEINDLERLIGSKSARLKNAEAYIKSNATDFKPFDLSKAKVDPINLRVRYSTKMDGGTPSGFVEEDVNLSKQDLYKFALTEKLGGGVLNRLFSTKATRDEADGAMKDLVAKFGEKKTRAIANQLRVGQSGNYVKFDDVFGARNGKMMELVDDEDYRRTTALKEQYFKEISDVSVPKAYPLYKDKAEQAKNLVTRLASVASDYSGIDKAYEEIAALATDEKSQFQINVDPAVSRYDKNAYTLQVTKASGEIITKSITQDQFKYLTGKNAPVVSADEINSNINAFGTGSTNTTYNYMDKNAYSTAYLKGDDFPNTSKYRVAADFAPGARGRYFPKLYIKTGDDWSLVQYNPGAGFQGFTKDEAENFPVMVDDIFINSLLQRK